MGAVGIVCTNSHMKRSGMLVNLSILLKGIRVKNMTSGRVPSHGELVSPPPPGQSNLNT